MADDTQAAVSAVTGPETGEPIAIVGMSCPGTHRAISADRISYCLRLREL